MKKSQLYLLIAILFLLNIFIGYKNLKLKDQIEDVKNVSNQFLTKSVALNDNFKKLIEFNYTSKLTSKSNDLINLLNEDKIILYITEGNCGSCIQESLNYFERLSEVIGKEKLVFLGNFKTKKDFDRYAAGISNFVSSSVFCNDSGLPNELNKQPFIFIAGKSMKVHSLFIPDFYPDYTETYFTKILPSYFDKTYN